MRSAVTCYGAACGGSPDLYKIRIFFDKLFDLVHDLIGGCGVGDEDTLEADIISALKLVLDISAQAAVP